MSWFETCAQEALYDVQIQIAPAIPRSGDRWNKGELATIKVNVINSSGLLLRDAVLRLSVSGAAKVVIFPGFPGRRLRDYWLWKEFEPGDTRTAYFILVGTDEGAAEIRAELSAEVVPYVTRPYDAIREEEIIGD